MYRLLVVDNESYVVNGLIELFRQLTRPELEVMGADSSAQALGWMTRVKIDIALLDIRMPGMGGLELQKEMNRMWPSCKVIFLTGYEDFSYAQQAIRNGAANYILKTEGDDTIVAAVERAIADLDAVVEKDSLILKSRQQMKLALEALRKDYLLHLILGDKHARYQLGEQLESLEIPLKRQFPVYMAIGRVDQWEAGYPLFERTLMLFAIQNIATEYLEIGCTHASFAYDQSRIVWLIQPKHPDSHYLFRTGEDAWKSTGRYIHGAFESVQTACRDLLKMPVSIVIAGEPTDWQDVDKQFDRLKRLLIWGLGVRTEFLLAESSDSGKHADRGEIGAANPGFSSRQTEHLVYCMENNLREDYFLALAEWMKREDFQPEMAELEQAKIYYGLVPMFMAFMDRPQLRAELGELLDISILTRYDLHPSWEAATEYLYKLSQIIFDCRNNGVDQQENLIIAQIKKYVEFNLSGDLTLTRIAEVIGHHPTYLSRMYKQKTGKGLSEHIYTVRLERSKEMLKQKHYKIRDVSRAVGFLSDHYFYRFFKKAMHMTPQEYRDSTE